MPVVRYDDSGMTTPHTDATYSPAIWGHLGIENNRDKWLVIEDHFGGAHELAASGVTGQWYVYLDGSNTVTTATDVKSGAIVLTTDGTDNDGPVLTSSGTSGAPFAFQRGRAFAFETRVKNLQVTNKYSLFVGVAEQNLAVNNGLLDDDATAVEDVDYVGFFAVGETSLTALNASYNTASGSTSPVEAKAAAHTVVADEFFKAGFRYDPSEDRLYYYINGVEVAGQTTVRIGSTDFPDGEEMAPYVCIKEGSANAEVLSCCFIRCAVEI